VTAPLLYLADLVLFVVPEPMVTLPFWTEHPVLLALLVGLVLLLFRGTLSRAGDARIRVWSLGWMAITLLPVATLTVGEHFLFLPSIGYCILVGSQLPPSGAAIDGRARRALAYTGLAVLAVALFRTALFDAGAAVAERSVKQAVAALDGNETAETLLVVDVSAAASLTFPYAVHLSRPDRHVDVETLSIAPALLSTSAPASQVDVSPPDRLELHREGGFLRSYIERALEGPGVSFARGQKVERSAYTVTVLDAPEGRLGSFQVSLHHPESTLVLRNTGHDLQVLALAHP
jgi:hypothetical protein